MRGRAELSVQRTGLESQLCQLGAGYPGANSTLPSCLSFLTWARGLRLHLTEELQGLYEPQIMHNAGSASHLSIITGVKAVAIHVYA